MKGLVPIVVVKNPPEACMILCMLSRHTVRELAYNNLNALMHEYLSGVPVDQRDLANAERAYKVARVRELYG